MASATEPVISRRLSLKSFINLFVILGLIGVIGWVVIFMTGFTAAKVPLLIVMDIPLGIGIAYAILMRATTEYRLYAESLEIEAGVISRSIENVQLFRVRDQGLQQSILGRILNFGNISLSVLDKNRPDVLLKGMEDPRPFYEAVRDTVAKAQANRRTLVVDDDEHVNHSDAGAIG